MQDVMHPLAQVAPILGGAVARAGRAGVVLPDELREGWRQRAFEGIRDRGIEVVLDMLANPVTPTPSPAPAQTLAPTPA